MKKQTRLLCIDDDPYLLVMFGIFFEKRGFSVLKAEDGEEGLHVYREQKPDIVLVDLKMPKKDGLEVLDTIVKESPDTPVIVISGEGEVADIIQALRLGAWNYQTKPIESMVIIQHAVDQALEKAQLIKENKIYQQGLEKKLRTVIENFDGFIFTCNKDWLITYMNPSLIDFIGRDAIGEDCYKALFDMETPPPWWLDDISCEGETVKQEIYSPRDNRWYHAIHSSIFDKDGQPTERQVILYDITERKQALLDLQEREEYLRKENIRLRVSLTDRYRFGDILGKSKPMQEVYETIINAAASNANVIIYGESGTGKELVAKAIHENSDRKDNRLVYVNCGATPENLIESEFFGYKKGAFTGATKDKYGFLDIADNGTLFLDEVGEIPLNMQVKLLRAIEGCGFTPVGGSEVKKPNVRIIAATNRDLKESVRQGMMRQDFLYRVHVIPFHLPPLRAHKEDIPLLVEHFLKQYDPEKIPPITPRILKALHDYDWPGNVRELQNTINRLVTLKKLDFIGLDLTGRTEDKVLDEIDVGKEALSLAELLDRYEKKVLVKILEKHNWQKTKAASALGIDRKTLFNKIKKHYLNS